MDTPSRDLLPKSVQWWIVFLVVTALGVYIYFHWPLVAMTGSAIWELLEWVLLPKL
ncbi:MAG TPA: hypothetical protein VJM77_07875 [Nitrospiria bacterium]|nr:hypothetical protein [Nitrospiria bacterium]